MLDYIVIVKCTCCEYSAEVATNSGSSSILGGKIKCLHCSYHTLPSFIMKYIHRRLERNFNKAYDADWD